MIMKRIVTTCVLVVALAGCGETALQQWAQGQRAYTGVVESMNDLMRFCTPNESVPDGNLDHPNCHVTVETAELFDVAQKRAKTTLDKARDNAVAERENDAKFYLREATRLIDDLLLYVARSQAEDIQ